MDVMDALYDQLLPGEILDVNVGLHRTGVLVRTPVGVQCGMVATLVNSKKEYHHEPSVYSAGHLQELSSHSLTDLIHSSSLTEASIGLAAINALLPQDPKAWIELNAEDFLIQFGKRKDIAVVGHFPFVKNLKPLARNLWVLELDPGEGDLPASSAPEILPKADLVAITATSLINKTFDGLIALCNPHSRVILLGPSTPLSPVLFDYGVNMLSGIVVTDPQIAMRGISQGATLHQLRQVNAVRLVTLIKR